MVTVPLSLGKARSGAFPAGYILEFRIPHAMEFRSGVRKECPSRAARSDSCEQMAMESRIS